MYHSRADRRDLRPRHEGDRRYHISVAGTGHFLRRKLSHVPNRRQQARKATRPLHPRSLRTDSPLEFVWRLCYSPQMADTQDESPESGNAQIIAPLADRLPELLPAETKFLEMLSGGAYATDAYEKAFPKRCAGKSRQYIGQLACAMRMKPNIRLWIAAITEAGM